MKTALIYLLQVIACSGILYGYYHFFLRNRKFHQYNRYYLVMAVMVSIVIPFLNIPVYVESDGQSPMLVKTLTVFEQGDFEENTVIAGAEAKRGYNWEATVSMIYFLAVVILFARFGIAIARILRMTRIYPGERVGNIRFIRTNDPSTPFSFFRWLFWNNRIEPGSGHGQQILRHEIFHIRQRHSWDIIFLEIVNSVFWLNPFFYFIRKETGTIHEFLADTHAAEPNREWDYAELLLMQVMGTPNTRLTNAFFQNQIKRRIAMLTTSSNPGYQYLRKIMVLPLAVIVTGLFAFTFRNKPGAAISKAGEKITIVIDPGHGNHDHGAHSTDKSYTEAELTLELAKMMENLAAEYNIEVVLTRTNENLPGNTGDISESLKERLEIANRVRPAAFISLHVNTTPDATAGKDYSGFEAYVSKNESSASNLLASAILQQLSPVYKTRAQARIRHSAGIYVLDQNNHPAVLLQCGFINNPDDLAFITERSNQEKIARSILEGIIKFNQQSASSTIMHSMADTIPGNPVNKNLIVSHREKIILQADSLIHHSDPTSINPEFSKSLVVINDQQYEPGILSAKTIISDEMHVFSKNDKEAVGMYGAKAANGLLVFKNARIIDKAPADYYNFDFNPNDTIPGKIVKTVVSSDTIRPLPGVVLPGKAPANENLVREVLVAGEPSKTREVVVAGYPKENVQKASSEKVHPVTEVEIVAGARGKTTIREVTVAGQPTAPAKATTVKGRPMKKASPASKPKEKRIPDQ